MQIKKRTRRTLVVLATVALSMLSIGAASAMATVHWSDTTKGIKVSGSVTAYKDGGSAVTCTAPSTQQSLFEEGDAFIWSAADESLLFNCSNGGHLGIYFYVHPTSTSSVEIGLEALATQPWSVFTPYRQGVCASACPVVVADFTNGSGATSSTVGFAKDSLGTTGTWESGPGALITISGTLKVTTSSGGLLTLLP